MQQAQPEKYLEITLRRSPIGRPARRCRTLQALGLGRRIGRRVYLPDHPSIQGMVRQVQHLVEVAECSDRPTQSGEHLP